MKGDVQRRVWMVGVEGKVVLWSVEELGVEEYGWYVDWSCRREGDEGEWR